MDKKISLKVIQYYEMIINNYGASLSASSHGLIARNESSLQNTKEEIELAFAIYMKSMKEHLAENEIVALKGSFCALDQFIPDHLAKIINKVHRNLSESSDSDKSLYNGFIKHVYLNPIKRIEEFNSF